MAKKFEIKYVRVQVLLDIPVLGNNGDAWQTDEEAMADAANYNMPDEYVTDSVEFVKVIRE